ncbi:ABC transporter ATP-binding protein [Nonomuraea sp. NPDC050404]|uniref:ABC transporter ATP-binding protein n=1 Tax=Nonomuraea sp. NPDC050404 TaxID=3155783 RepID=UPI00340D9342
MILKVENLRTRFHHHDTTVEAVNDVSFDLPRGTTLAIVGESGSGKSVTARSLLQILDPGGRIEHGTAMFTSDPGGESIDLLSLDPRGPEIRAIRGRQISMIFQEPMASLSPMYTVGGHLVEVLRIHLGLDKAQAWERGVRLLAKVGIPQPEARMTSYPFQLSGGMCQRVMTAIALACEPRLLIADEPTTALDVTTQAKILDLLDEIKATEELSMLFITHDLGVVARVADTVAVMRDGDVVEHGEVDQIFHDPRHDYTKHLLGSRPTAWKARSRVTSPVPEDQAPPRIAAVDDLYVTFDGQVHAVRGVSFDIYAGETLGLVGESGSGKTTTGRCLVAAQKPSSGDITYWDADGAEHDIAALGKRALKKLRTQVRMIFQDPYTSLNPRMTLLDIIADPLRVNGLAKGGEIKERVARALETVGLHPDHMNRYPHAFSGGQRQRVNIARALITEPRLVIADEAVSALDVSVRAQILELLQRLQEELGLTYLFISHDLSVVEAICDRVAVMRYGRLVEVNTTAALFSDPQEDYTRELLDAVPVPDPRLYAS